MYRLTPALADALIDLGFRWDASIMRAWGFGRNADRAFRDGDYFVMGERLLEFPMGAWRRVRLPLNHPYTLLAGRVGGRILRTMCGPSGMLVAYNVHMTDLLSGRVDLKDFTGLVACGGFSYGDVLGAGSGWAKSILFNDAIQDMFRRYSLNEGDYRTDRGAFGFYDQYMASVDTINWFFQNLAERTIPLGPANGHVGADVRSVAPAHHVDQGEHGAITSHGCSPS
jgi:hypothetical protein